MLRNVTLQYANPYDSTNSPPGDERAVVFLLLLLFICVGFVAGEEACGRTALRCCVIGQAGEGMPVNVVVFV